MKQIKIKMYNQSDFEYPRQEKEGIKVLIKSDNSIIRTFH